ncbi:MAG: hypothetical protein IJI62_11495 [Lachnospiraceae bacterium]|nr:hypothetical protein [Lachnospiraceae bacterium]
MRDNLDQRFYQNQRAARDAEQERQQAQQMRQQPYGQQPRQAQPGQDPNWSWREDRSGLRRERLQGQGMSMQNTGFIPQQAMQGMQSYGRQPGQSAQQRRQQVDIPIPHSKKVDIPIAYTTPGQQNPGSRVQQNYANRGQNPASAQSYANRGQNLASRRLQPTSSGSSFANRPQSDRADRIAQAAQAQRRAERAQSSRADHAQTRPASAQAAAGARSGQSDFNRRTREARMRRNEQLRRRRNFFRALPLIIVLLIAAGFGIYKLVQVAQEHAEIRAEQQRADEEARRHEQELLAQQEAEAAAAKAAEEEKAAALAALSERSPEVASFAEGYTVVDQNPAYIGLDQDGQSTYGVLIDVDAGKVIAAKNHHERIYPASMTKIMTVLVAIEKIQRAAIEQDVPVEDILNRKVVITQNHTNYAFSHGGSIVGFSIGETPTVEDLLYGTILPSGADAAAALAEFIVYDLGAVADDETASVSTGEASAGEGQETAGTEGTQEGAAEAASAAEDGTAATAETTENAAESQILTATDAQAAAASQNAAGTQATGETAQTAPAETEEGEAEQAPQAEVDEAAVAAAAESVPAELNARLVEDTQEQFAVLMNEKVADLGLSSTTHFTNSVGMHDEQNYTTMVSMAMILKAAVENDLCRKVLSEHIYTTSKTPQHPNGIEISNWFLRRIEDKDSHGEVVAAKTGFVNESGCCSASYQVSNSGGHYICVTGNAWSSWRCIYDHVEVYEHFTN